MKITHPAVPLALVFAASFCQLSCAPSSATAKSTPEVQALTRFSTDGKDFVQDVDSARTAIFNGDPKTAEDLMNKAKVSLDAAKKDAPSFNVKTTTSVHGKTIDVEQATTPASLVPVDGRMVVDDDYVLTPEKQAHIDKANEHLKKGEAKAAAEELKLAQVNVDFNRMWIPIVASGNHLDDAIKLARDGKYYQASLALKSIDDGITTDSVDLSDAAK